MTMLRWQPQPRNANFSRLVGRFFDETLWPTRSDVSANGGSRPLAVNISEGPDEVVVTSVIPGVDPDKVDITMEDGYLSIRAEVLEYSATEDAHWVRREIAGGHYARRVSLPEGVEADKAEATCDHGVLTLRIPKAESAKPKQIKIEAKAAA